MERDFSPSNSLSRSRNLRNLVEKNISIVIQSQPNGEKIQNSPHILTRFIATSLFFLQTVSTVYYCGGWFSSFSGGINFPVNGEKETDPPVNLFARTASSTTSPRNSINRRAATWRRRNDRFINGGERASFKLGFMPPPLSVQIRGFLSFSIRVEGWLPADRFLLLDWRKLVAQSDRYPIAKFNPLACDCSLESLEWKTIFWPRPCVSSRNRPRISIPSRRGFGSNRGSLEGIEGSS